MNRRVLITDLDNTLYDWYAFFIPAFYAMASEAARIVDCSEEQLITDMRNVHIHFGDVEHPFALLEAKSVRDRFPNKTAGELIEILDPALHKFNQVRKENLKLFPTVRETLQSLKDMRVTIIGHTDSRSLAAIGRLERLEIIDFFDVVYCQMRHDAEHPLAERRLHWDRLFSKVMIKELPRDEKKPDPQVLRDILAAERLSEQECIFVGDSKSRDILMAKKAGVFAAWAKYGAWHNKDVYEKLIAISHWTKREVDEELAYSAEAKKIEPSFTIEQRFEEILPLYQQAASSAA